MEGETEVFAPDLSAFTGGASDDEGKQPKGSKKKTKKSEEQKDDSSMEPQVFDLSNKNVTGKKFQNKMENYQKRSENYRKFRQVRMVNDNTLSLVFNLLVILSPWWICRSE